VKSAGTLTALSEWYEQRPLRERVLLLLCLLVVLFFLWDSLVMSPIDMRKKSVHDQINKIETELSDLAARETVALARKDFDPDRDDRQRFEELKAAIENKQQQLGENVVNLISPQEMPDLLKELLIKQRGLQLLSLENLPAETLQINDAATESEFSPVLYRHRLRLEFSGDYLTTLAYLKKLENLPRRLAWEEVEIETQNYPQAKVLLQVYTLSLAEGWIGG
jgi:MSHA biogenesis protein MshJ